jgi:hypothetical protein
VGAVTYTPNLTPVKFAAARQTGGPYEHADDG